MFGTDHAGIATQMVVERQLAADGQTRHDLGRDAFVEKIWEWIYYSPITPHGRGQHEGAF